MSFPRAQTRGGAPRLEQLEPRLLLAGDLCISEFMADNDSTLADEDGQFSDWIEIQNAGVSAVSLSGWFLTDEEADLTKWALPDVTIAAGGRLVVFASDKDRTDPAGELHTNFKLNDEGEYLALVRPDGVTVQHAYAPYYPPQVGDVSYGVNITSAVSPLVTAGALAAVEVPADASDGTGWTGDPASEPFDETAWVVGATGVGFGFPPLAATDISGAMMGVHSSAYLRIPFVVGEDDLFQSLQLRMKYDDGFVAYVNGVEVARRNAPATPSWDSAAPADRPDGEAQAFEVIDIFDTAAVLLEGVNVLAIHGLSSGAADTDFLVLPELDGVSITFGADRYYADPTPGAANAVGFEGLVADTKFSVGRGFYDTAFDVTVTSDTPGATLVYTTNGSIPTLINGTQVPPADGDTPPSVTLNIAGTTTLRAAAFKVGWEPTNVDTQTYIFLDGVVAQPALPAGFPASWGSAGAADYQMSPTVVAAYGVEGMKQALLGLPTVSLVMSLSDLFGTMGIYSNPSAKGMGAERRVSMEWINPDGTPGVQADAGIRIQGMSGRGLPKKSFRLVFRSMYGDSKLEYPVFADSLVDSFDHLILRAGMNDSVYGDVSGAQYTRDGWAMQTYRQMGHVALYGTYVHLYINGLYWGLYNPIERITSAWAASQMGGEKDSDWDVFKANAVVDGNSTYRQTLFQIANGQGQYGAIGKAPAYEQLKQYVNVEAVADYAILNFYAGTGDWRDGVNYASYNKRDDNPGYSPLIWDAENVLESVTANVTSSTCAEIQLHRLLLANDDYRTMVADRIYMHFFHGGALTVAANRARYDALMDSIDPAIKGEEARWADGASGSPFSYARWLSEWNWVDNTFLTARPAVAMQQFISNGMYPTISPPTLNQHGGQVPAGFELELTAAAGEICFTLDGTDPRMMGADSGQRHPHATVYTGPVRLDGNAHVMARVRGTDGQWSPLVEAFFTVADSPVQIGEIMYNPAGDPGVVAVVDEDFDGGAGLFAPRVGNWSLSAGKYVAAPVSYKPGGSVTAINLALSVVPLQADLPAQFVIAADVRASVAASQPLVVFDYHGPDNFKFAGWHNGRWEMGRRDFNGSNTVWYVDTWANGTLTPGVDYHLEVSVTEQAASLHVNGQWVLAWDFSEDLPEGRVGLATVNGGASFDNVLLQTAFNNDDYEFVELANVSERTVSLKGMRFDDGIEFTFGDLALPPGGHVVAVSNPVAFAVRYGADGIVVAGTYKGNFSNAGEHVSLVDGAGVSVAGFDYADWYPAADGEGMSLTVAEPSLLSDPLGWRPSAYADGTPGWAVNVLINEVCPRGAGAEGDWIELYNASPVAVELGGMYLSDDPGQPAKYRIADGVTVAAGEYIVFNQRDHFGAFFALGNHGGSVVLSSVAVDHPLRGYRQSAAYGGAAAGATFGRYATAGGVDFVRLDSPTMGLPNSGPLIGPVVVSEIMYHPVGGGYEFIELHNATGSPVSLVDVSHPTHAWRMGGDVSWTFSAGDVIPAGGYVLVSGVDPALLRAAYGLGPEVAIYGPWSGSLSDSGGVVEVSAPGVPDAGTGTWSYVTVERIEYGYSWPWLRGPGGHGPSLERMGLAVYGNDPLNWQDTHGGGSPGAANLVNPAGPVADAGPALMVGFGPPATAQLNGTISDDGFPLSGELTATWTLVSGPGWVEFDDPHAVDAVVTFETQGQYTFRLTVTDGDLSAWDETVVTVTPPVYASASAVPTSGMVGMTVTFTGLATGGTPGAGMGGFFIYRWDFADGGTSERIQPSHRYDDWGVMEVVLTVSDGYTAATDTVLVYVAPFLGDANADGVVGIADLAALADNYGKVGATWMEGDFSGDGKVGIADLATLADHYGERADGAAQVGGSAETPEQVPPPPPAETAAAIPTAPQDPEAVTVAAVVPETDLSTGTAPLTVEPEPAANRPAPADDASGTAPAQDEELLPDILASVELLP
ncbi:MAG TPA: lamin tail domain-containing protein [Phycisphaerae bacterium]|nr:lamin tail domain-containing protein [Phycisphaerae bacterium]